MRSGCSSETEITIRLHIPLKLDKWINFPKMHFWWASQTPGPDPLSVETLETKRMLLNILEPVTHWIHIRQIELMSAARIWII